MMNRLLAAGMCGIVLGTLGCARIESRVVEKPRLDQQMQGNRGVLMGTAPPVEKPRSETRQVVEIHIDLPTGEELNPWRKPKPAAEPESAGLAAAPATAPAVPPREEPPAPEWEEPPSVWEEPEPVRVAPMPGSESEPTLYIVRKGDTLEKIAEKFYGDGKRWRRIYNANRDRMTSPNRIYEGQQLVIPPAPEEPASGAYK